jgi:hypothetical protein
MEGTGAFVPLLRGPAGMGRSVSGHGKFDDALMRLQYHAALRVFCSAGKTYAWASSIWPWFRGNNTLMGCLLLVNVRYLRPPSLTADSLVFAGHIKHLILISMHMISQ